MSFLKNLGGAFGDIAGGFLGFMGAEQQGDDMIRNTEIANQFSANQMAMNREFQERMSSTSYQRGMNDMQAAGLNPMLAYSQGGASSPSGNAAQGIAAGTVNKLGAAVSSAQTYAQLENVKAQTDKTRAETDNIKASKIEYDPEGNMKHPKTFEAKLTYVLGEKRFQELKHEVVKQELTEKEIKQVEQYILNLKTKNRLEELNIPKAVNEAKAQGSWYMREIAPYTGELGKGISGAATLRGMSRPDFQPYKRQFPNRR